MTATFTNKFLSLSKWQILKTWPTNNERTIQDSPPAINANIQRRTLERLQKIGFDRDEIEIRLFEIDHEWDIERAFMAQAAFAHLLSLGMFSLGHKKWILLSVASSGFIFQQAFKGWCPPMYLLRRLGLRTHREMETERFALKALRGDFQYRYSAFSPIDAFESSIR